MSFLRKESTQSLKQRSTSELYMRRLCVFCVFLVGGMSERGEGEQQQQVEVEVERTAAVDHSSGRKKKIKKKSNRSPVPDLHRVDALHQLCLLGGGEVRRGLHFWSEWKGKGARGKRGRLLASHKLEEQQIDESE